MAAGSIRSGLISRTARSFADEGDLDGPLFSGGDIPKVAATDPMKAKAVLTEAMPTPATPPPEGSFACAHAGARPSPTWSDTVHIVAESADQLFRGIKPTYTFESGSQFLGELQRLTVEVHRARCAEPAADPRLEEIENSIALLLLNVHPVYDHFVRTGESQEIHLPSGLVSMLQATSVSHAAHSARIIADSPQSTVSVHSVSTETHPGIRSTVSYVKKYIPFRAGAETVSRRDATAEASYARTLNHPHIVKGYGHVHRRGGSVLFLEHIKGKTVAAMLRSGGISLALQQQCLREVKDALCYLHSRKVCYGDLKPSNILYDEEGDRFVLVDLGSVKRIGEPHGATTLAIAPPEAFRAPSSPIRPSFDVWSFGALRFSLETGGEMLSGAKAPGDEFAFLKTLFGDPESAQAVIRDRFAPLFEETRAALETLLALNPAARTWA